MHHDGDCLGGGDGSKFIVKVGMLQPACDPRPDNRKAPISEGKASILNRGILLKETVGLPQDRFVAALESASTRFTFTPVARLRATRARSS